MLLKAVCETIDLVCIVLKGASKIRLLKRAVIEEQLILAV